MAEYLASIFGTEKDKVNCSFYFKIGACRHGDRCSRLHNKPTFSQPCPLSSGPAPFKFCADHSAAQPVPESTEHSPNCRRITLRCSQNCRRSMGRLKR
ncbi:T0173386 isoform 1 [Pongo abelii]|uniref:T0173386 isoform 1 n=1 Tax=Pongo abelii TaxID=9601 RepID=A0A2J8RRR5_PONAB|nr:T0173386 isoform 1 [Pongo abelii]